ncbi:glycosomal membrane protein [Trypanosoma theileri]|uniref:Glycosomal membrane protein n=1 Tax=Trypanosoma theileri TaxID=67003 RepID=A0A1X0NR15_9TRYP|nr:glycosomal membrane protein [Trypanosoma theileri]ORC87041.1 glycosomal membrane protein [Trypanosoma theileri]
MSDYDKFVKLLAQTDGRDKIYKAIAGLVKVLGTVDTVPSHLSTYKKLGSSIGDGRSLMRMAKWAGDIPKMRSALVQCRAKGGIDLRKLLEFLRVLGNFLYVLGDNAAFLSRHRLILAGSHKQLQKHSKVAQFWGFLLATVLDLLALRAALRRHREGDATTARREARAAATALAKDAADTLVTMAAVGYLRGVWHPGAATTGSLTLLSGAIATHLNWAKIK